MRPPSAHDRIAVALAAERRKAIEARARQRATHTEEERQALRDHCAAAMLEALRRLGSADPSSVQDENGFLHFACGSVQCTLGMVALEERDLFLVYAPIMDLPSDRELLLPLYRLLLELNNRFELSVAKFGLHADTVFLSAMRHLDGLDAEEVADMVRWVSSLANDMDERLLTEFGGTTKQRKA